MDKIFSEILSLSIDSLWIITAVIIVRAILQKAPMYFRKILWGLVGLRLLIPFSFESAFSLVPHETQRTTDRIVDQVVAIPAEQGLTFWEVLPFLWISIATIFLVYGIISYIKLKLKIIDSVLVKENVYCSEKIASPFVCGFIKPRIYLPYGLDEATQNCVLQHEKTHIKFADHIVKAISFIVLCIHWFNPLVWVSYFLFFKDVELSCDESVVKKYDSEGCIQYAKALLDLGVNKVKFTACPVAFGEISIKSRIKSVINYKKSGGFLIFISLSLCIGVVLCFMTEPEVKAQKRGSPQNVEKKIEFVTEPITEKNDIPKEDVTEKTTEIALLKESEQVSEIIKTNEPVFAEKSNKESEKTTEPTGGLYETVASEHYAEDNEAVDNKAEDFSDSEMDVDGVFSPDVYIPVVDDADDYKLIPEQSYSQNEEVFPAIPDLFSEEVITIDNDNSVNPYYD